MKFKFFPALILIVLIIAVQFLLAGSLLAIEKAEETKKTFQIPEIEEKIKIDGTLSEEAWAKALKVVLDIEIMPGENIETSFKTECFLAYDRHNLYVGFIAHDPEPDKIRAFYNDRDNCWQDDLVGIILDTFNDENRAFTFFVNPLGIQADEIMSLGGQQEDMTWDAIWNSAARITGSGYEVEMAIPFSSLQFQPSRDEQTWGFVPLRIVPRSRRYQISIMPFDRNNPCTLCQAPKITGFKGISPGRNLELDPTLTAARTDAREEFPSGGMKKLDSKADLGVSGSWYFTNNMNLSAAVNPDFSQVEADVAQLDINKQFALYYSEKRPFFLEGRDFFETPVEAFYSRSIADPDWGVKISGKAGKNVIGLVSAQDTMTNLIFPGPEGSRSTSLGQRSYANVFRFRRDVAKGSTIGLIVTDREGEGYHNRVAGLDGLIRFTSSDTLTFQVLGSDTDYPDEVAETFGQKQGSFSGYGGSIGFSRNKRSYYLNAQYDFADPDARADLGFVPQVGYKRFEVGGGLTRWGKKGDFFNRMTVFSNYDQSAGYDGNLLEREWEAGVDLEGPLWSYFNWDIGTRKKVYLGHSFNQVFNQLFFSIRPAGNFSFNTWLSFRDEIDYENIRDGKAFEIEPEMDIRLGRHLQVSLSHLISRLKVEGGRLFLANLTQSKIIYHFNNRVFLRAIFQYQDVNKNPELYTFPVDENFHKLFSQLLFSYKLNPRTVLFLGYSDNYFGYNGVSLTQADRTFFFKIGYAWNL
ncbi:MAG: DUF5916 domain-containing protein [Acidobacteriota bacterium]|nr:DUF5916 domain-containing protein [Acidobacteriota bacterium]